MNILITGGAGYIGSVLISYLLDRKYKVTVLDNLMYGQTTALLPYLYNKDFRFINADVKSPNILKETANETDIVIPLACLVGAPLCNSRPESEVWDINCNQIKLLSDLGKSIIYPTTNSGYGIGGDGYCDETYPLNPLTLYGRTKVAAEKFVVESGGISYRLATVFGSSPRQRLDLLVNDFVWRAKRDNVLVLFEEHFRRNYIHVRDVCHAILHAIDSCKTMSGQIYNVGLSSANLTKRELAEKVKEHIPGLTIISSIAGKDPDKRNYIVSNDKLEATGWKPRYTLDDGILEIMKLYDIMNTVPSTYRNHQ